MIIVNNELITLYFDNNKKNIQKYKTEKVFIYRGYKCIVIGQKMGHRCGYVGVNRNNKYYGKESLDICDIDVHGGITYAAETFNNYPYKDNLWWLGFDCAHCYDKKDINLIKELNKGKTLTTLLNTMILDDNEATVKTTAYVIRQCKLVVNQIINNNKEK